ncbi:MAG: DUF6062 family protein, partial [Halanaerobiales bacterium]
LKNKDSHRLKERIARVINFNKNLNKDENKNDNEIKNTRFKKEKCMVCKTIDQNVNAFEKTLVENLKEESFQDLYKKSDGLCLPHFHETINLIRKRDKNIYLFLINEQEKKLKDLLINVKEVQKKKSYDNFEKVKEDEALSWQEGIWRYTGWKPEKLLTKD